jgi:hypothetical protein
MAQGVAGAVSILCFTAPFIGVFVRTQQNIEAQHRRAFVSFGKTPIKPEPRDCYHLI